MSLSLQVKKFINSEHMGDYVSITLPGYPDRDGNVEPEQARIHYMEAGVGEPMLLVHTIGQSLYTWRNVFEELSRHYRVIAVDLLGHGYSGRPVQFDYTIEEQSMALELFLNAKGIESTHIVGFSMGSLYALDFCIRHPERVGRMVLCSPGGLTPEMPLMIRMIDSPFFGSLACRLYNYKSVSSILQECLFDLTVLNDEVLGAYYSTISDGYSRKAIQLSLHNFDEEQVEQNLRTIQNDILILWGSEDKWHPPQSSELYHAALRNAQFGIVRNAGHLMHEEKPARFIEAIKEYIPVLIDEQ